MTREEIINGLKFTVEMFLLDPSTGETITEPRNDMDKTTIDACRGAIELLEQEPSGDLISRADRLIDLANAIEIDDSGYWTNKKISSALRNISSIVDALPSVKQEPKIGQFAKWVATEIFDDNWEYNKDAFAEIACRKLAKLGIVRANGDEWELVEPQESEGKE